MSVFSKLLPYSFTLKAKTIELLFITHVAYFKVQTMLLATSSVVFLSNLRSSWDSTKLSQVMNLQFGLQRLQRVTKKFKIIELKPLKIFIVFKCHIFNTAETKAYSFEFSLQLYVTKVL